MEQQVIDAAAAYPIVSSDMTIKAMRDSGYKSTAHAIAELIDNGIEENADLVELFAVESTQRRSERARYHVEKIAVMDNGNGMDRETLRRSLRFGVGSRQERKGIGRFGVGLPNSSMSQCQRVDVWSWQNGPENALHTHLDLEEINGKDAQVPEPRHDPVPEEWQNLSQGLGPSGTLVLWTKLDRVQWVGAETTLRRTEELIGRIYRRFIADGRCRIRLVPVHGWDILEERDALPNDPLYLTERTSTPFPFDNRPMFRAYGGGSVGKVGVEEFMVEGIDGKKYPVRVRASIAEDASRRPDVEGQPWPDNISPTMKPGATPWGKHAARNLGVSLIRADRELDLDKGWVSVYDPVERWWGIEIEFDPQLDEVFGVTNNKQSATAFSELAHFDWNEEADGSGMTWDEFKEQLAEDGDPKLKLMDIVYQIRQKLISKLRKDLEDQTRGTGTSRKRHEKAEAAAEQAVKKRRVEAGPSLTDTLEKESSPEESQQLQFESLVETHKYPEADAKRIIEETMAQHRHVRLLTSRNPDSPAFFNIEFIPGMLQVALNMDHPVYNDLVAVLDSDVEGASQRELADRLERAASAFKLLMFSWARFEDELPEGSKTKDRVKKMRQDWGRLASEFFTADDEEDDE
ncbi:ATP-binding protein [Streptomyces sp. Je 1-4]|uniref:ATP-binding protein n=1 Tax=Streptomyces TaxID=1883 RepID=UPI0021D7FF51|nr:MULTISPECIES: ATP-binding protein [unclassified Streptomyces]UYB40877.1 ATP-binding protein [Streptomyces sp. Je 1-4]UZQ37036.1 ATP-binding protein [Streptomyces sp. Je 1-4] [Streptomyces sp. Je 1-4 4N24]UZQ44453.1 ATP-binding protein [Streptomyces sp. Je 1-4] [Streptomyces sp. Je 1-4 4N24_ara]